jgi:hypothetical protein
MIVVGSVRANAEEETIATFTASEYNSGTTGGWTVSNADYATAGGGYYKLITSDASIVTPSINWSNYSDITITISARKFGGPDATQGKISVSQGETELTSYSPSGTSIVASSALKISPADGTITISCPGASSSKGCGVGSIIIKGTPAVSKTLSSISLSGTYPTTFKVGDTFSHEGMIVTANYDDNTSEDVTAYATFEGYDMSTAGEQEVTVSYTKGEVTKTATYDITVENVLLTGITLSGDYPTTFTVGDAFSHEGMTVTANYNDNTSEDVTADATFGGYDMSTAGEQEVTVSYTKGGVTKTAAYNITVNALTGDAYTLVTNVADLADGDNVIIVNTDAEKAMSTTQNTNNRAATAVTFDEDGNAIVPSSTDIQVFTLEGNSNGWYFYTGSGYLYASSSTANQLRTEAEKDDNGNAKASLEIDSQGDATIKFQGTNSRNMLKYNSGNDIFACYVSGQSPVQIYRKPVSKTLTSIMLSGEYPTTFFVGAEFSFGETGTVTAVYDDNSTKVVTELATFSGYDMNTAGTQTVTVSYTERGVTKTQTYDITVNNRALSSITLSGDYPTTFNVGDTFSHEGMTVTATYDNNTSEDVTADATFEGYDMSTAGTQTVTVSYTKADVTKTATYEITVNAVAVTGITLNKEAVQLKVGKTTKLTATVEPDNATDKTVVWSSGDETVATVSEDGTVTAVAEGTATITAGTPDGAQTATCTVTVIAATAATEYYEKVTSAPEDWSGEYLIVYEDGSVAFDGSLSTLDAAGNTIEVEIEDNKIEATDDVNDAAFTIAKMEGGYSVKAASGKFIGATSYANSLASSDSEIANSLSLDASGNAVIKVTTSGGDVTLRYNYGSNQLRFRYYKSGQQAIQLYKKVEATSVTTYSLVKNDNTEIAFEGLTLTTDALPAEAHFHIKDNFGNNYYAISTDEEIPYAVAITAENHDDLSTRVSTSDDIEDICRFFLGKQNTWVFTITPAEDGTIKLAVNPKTPTGETKYMIADETPYTETENVFTEDGKLTKVMTTASFFIVKSDDYAIVPLVPAESNTEDESRHPVWEFSGTANQVGFSMGNPYALDNYTYPYRMSEADTYNFTLDLENNTVTVEAVPTTYTLVADGGYGWSEWEFDGLLLNEEFPNGTEFYIKDNKGNVYYGEYGNSIIYAENHENLNTYYPVEDETVTEKPEPFELRRDAIWHFTITEPAEDGETIKLTVVPSTIEEIETKYMLSSAWMQTSEDVFDENLQITKDFTAGEAFYITREDGFGIFNVTAAESNVQEGAVVTRVWEFSEDAPTVGYVPAKTLNAFRMKDAGTYTITLDTENQTVTIETVPTTYTLVAVGETLTEYPFSSLTLTKELPAHTEFYIKDNKDNEYHSADAQSELIIIAENHENLPTSADGKYFYLKKANTWVFTLTEASDGLMLTVSPETEGETKYMLSGYLQESDDVFDENLKLTKEMTSTTEEFYFTRSDDYGLTNLTPATFNAPEDRRYWIFNEDDPTVEFIAGEIRGSYTVGEAGTYTFTIDLTNNTVTAEKTVEGVDLTISSAEWTTFVTPSAVLFPEDVTAYIITELTGNNAKAEQITEAPAGTPVIVNGAEGIHKLPYIGKSNAIENNELLASDGNVTGDGTIYVLAVEGGQAGFAPLANGKKLSEGKAYLKVENASGAKINFVIDDATDIRGIESTVDFSDGDWYNLQGVKVTSPQRGIYIHNGKKVVVK